MVCSVGVSNAETEARLDAPRTRQGPPHLQTADEILLAWRALATKRDKIHTVVMNLGCKLNARYFEKGSRL
jgi:hypothetical protein